MKQDSNIEKDLFAEALELPAHQREGFLKGVCRGNAELRQRIEDLLRVHGEAGGILSTQDVVSTQIISPPLTEKESSVIGRYKLLQKIGEGGCGVVYMAEQSEPVRRRVALKVIKLGMDTKSVIARFEAERQALAMMDHPNIAKVLDGGATDTGRPYFVMELVRGTKITEYCDENNLSTRDRLDLFIKVCQAIQHAHQKGVIHRDIKPSNILITVNDGVAVPKVIDFGIAKATTGQQLTDKTLFTAFEQFIGTPAYMSPEQAVLTSVDIDTRSDIYSLGVLLYEMLTGKTPFDAQELLASGLDEMRRTIREKEPVPPSTRLSTMAEGELTTTVKHRRSDAPKLVNLLRGDVDWIVMKCLEKDRARRYDTANGLASDLLRHLNNEPVTARPPSAVYRFQKAWRRNKVACSAGLAIVFSLFIGLAASLWQTRRAWLAERKETHLREVADQALQGETEQRALADQERQRAEQRELESRKRSYASDMNVAKQALDENNLGRALKLLEQHRPKQGQVDLRGWEWRYLWSQTRSDASFTLCQETNEIRSLSVSSDGNFLAISVHGRGGLSLWSLRERREVARLAQEEQEACAVISPTEPLVAFTGIRYDASGKQRSTLRLWNFMTRRMLAEERPLDGECKKLAIANDGKRLVTVTQGNPATYQGGGYITLWSLPDGLEQHKYPLTNSPGGFAVTPDLGLAAVSMDGLRVIKLEDNRELWEKDIEAKVLAFSPDGKWLAGDSNGRDIVIWNAATGEEASRLTGHQSSVKALVFWPDGKKLVSGSADQTIRIWDVPGQACVDTLRGHRQQVWELALIPDENTVISGSRDGTVCLWDTSARHLHQRRIDIPNSTSAWAFEADSKSVVTFNKQGRVTRYKGPNFEVPETLLETGIIPEGEGFSWCFSEDGRRFVRSSPDGIVQVWDIPNRSLRRQFAWPRSTEAKLLARRLFAGGNRLLLFAVQDFVIHDLDLTTGSEVQSWRVPASYIHFAISPDERYCVTLGYDGDAVITDLLKKATTKLTIDARESHDGTYSPDGRLLAVPNSLGLVRIWDTATWNEEKNLGGFFDEVFGSVFFPDGRRLAAVASDHEAMRLYDTSTWLDTITLEADGGILWPSAVSPDGNVIGASTWTWAEGTLRLWRAPSWEEIEAREAKEKARIKQP